METEIWIGLAEVVSLPGCQRLGSGKGAFVNIALWASSDFDFQTKAAEALGQLDLHLVELEDREPLAKRLSSREGTEEVLRMAEIADRNRTNAVFGTFHIWERSDA